jgi:hypothetical protein
VYQPTRWTRPSLACRHSRIRARSGRGRKAESPNSTTSPASVVAHQQARIGLADRPPLSSRKRGGRGRVARERALIPASARIALRNPSYLRASRVLQLRS